MPFFYSISLATAGNLTTNGTPNTETDAFFVKPGVRTAELARVDVQGKSVSLSTMSSIAFRIITLATASTAGTSITPTPADPGMQAAKSSAASRPTIGATRKQHKVFGCTATGPGGWYPINSDECVVAEGGAAGSVDMVDVSGVASLPYEWSAAFTE